MLKKILPLCLILGIIIGFQNTSTAASENIVIVKIDGHGRDENAALENSNERAVYKLLAQIIKPDNNPNSLFSRLVKDYRKYVISAKTIALQQEGREYLAIVNVEIDRQKLLFDYQAQVAKVQQQNLTSAIFIRAINFPNGSTSNEQLQTTFNKNFGEKGFLTEYQEESEAYLSEYQASSFPYLKNGLLTKAQRNDLFVDCLVIGEARLTSLLKTNDDLGYQAIGEIEIFAYDLVRQKEIAAFKEDYTLVAPTQAKAAELLLAKMAVDAGEQLAKDTLLYWRQN